MGEGAQMVVYRRLGFRYFTFFLLLFILLFMAQLGLQNMNDNRDDDEIWPPSRTVTIGMFFYLKYSCF